MVSDAHIDVASEDFRTTYGLDEEPAQEHFLNWHFGVGPSVNARSFVKPKVPLYLDYQVCSMQIKCIDKLHYLRLFLTCVTTIISSNDNKMLFSCDTSHHTICT